jgi:hypothetical protein
MKADILDEMKARHARELAEATAEQRICEMLPESIGKAPTISNHKTPDEMGRVPAAWLGFRAPSYDPKQIYNPIALVESLEGAGWKLVPATLVRWDNYRPTVEPGLQNDQPSTKQVGRAMTYEFRDSWPIAPVWIEANQHTAAEIWAYMTAPDGTLYLTHFDLINLPGCHVYLTAKRNEYRGGWSYERGTARLNFPERWHGHQAATIDVNSRAWVDTEQGLSGTIYFSPHGGQDEWPLTFGAFLRSLLAEETATTPAK